MLDLLIILYRFGKQSHKRRKILKQSGKDFILTELPLGRFENIFNMKVNTSLAMYKIVHNSLMQNRNKWNILEFYFYVEKSYV